MDSLSSELILEILLYIDHSGLMNIYTCSHRLYAIAQPLIYSTFTQSGQHALPNLLRSIIAKPILATYIKHLSLSILGRRHDISFIDTSFLASTDLAWIRAQLLSSGWSKEWVKDWVIRLTEKDNWDATAGLLLCLCSQNLESLALHGGQNIETQTIRSTLEFAADQQSYFQKLRRISLLSKPAKQFNDQLIPHNSTSPELLSSALKFPQWEEIHLEGLFGQYWDSNIAKALLQSSSPITTKKLSFTQTQLDVRVLERFLLRFNALTHFKYQAECYHVSGTHLVNTNIKSALANSRHTLTHLSLDPGDEWYNMGPGSSPNDPVLGDMSSFPKLKYLEVDSLMLLGEESGMPDPNHPDWTEDGDYYTRSQCSIFANGFPISLEKLIIHRCGDAILGPVTELLGSRKLAGMREVVLGMDMWELRNAKRFEACDECVALAAGKGVLLRYGPSYSLRGKGCDADYGVC